MSKPLMLVVAASSSLVRLPVSLQLSRRLPDTAVWFACQGLKKAWATQVAAGRRREPLGLE